MATEQDFKQYCVRHGLTFVSRDGLDVLFGAEEWDDDVSIVGFFDDPSQAAPGALLKRDGTVEVVKAFADGRKRLEDTWGQVTDGELSSGHRLHAV